MYLDELISIREHDKPSKSFDDAVHSVSDLMPLILSDKAFQRPSVEQTILDNWQTIAGHLASTKTRPARLENNCLQIYVSSSTWLYELERNYKRKILTSLQATCPDAQITSIRFILDPLGNVGTV